MRDPHAVTGTVLVAVLAAGVALLRPSPPAVASRVVHLSGDVARPGWYPADRLGDAVAAAGGHVDYLAAPVADGARVRVVGSYLVPTAPPAPVRTDAWHPGKLGLNVATQAQLEELPRVGPVLAARIVAGRPYRSLADLDRVKGIGPATLALLRPLVSP